MEQNNIKDNVVDLINDVKKYANTRTLLLSLQLKKIASELIASLGSGLIILIFAVLMFIFGSFALAYYFSEIYQSVFKGFAIVSGIYFLLFVISLLMKSTIKNFISNTIIKILFKEESNENDQE